MLHGNPQCAASTFALHLEQMYGLQLDPYRHKQLVAELEEYAGRVDEGESTDEPAESDPAANDLVAADPAFKGLFIPPTMDAGNYKEETADAV